MEIYCEEEKNLKVLNEFNKNYCFLNTDEYEKRKIRMKKLIKKRKYLNLLYEVSCFIEEFENIPNLLDPLDIIDSEFTFTQLIKNK